VVVVAGGAVEAVVGGLADEVDPEGDDGDAEPRGCVAQLVPHHRVPPPLVPPPEELPRRVQSLACHRLRLRCSLPVSLSLTLVTTATPRAQQPAKVIYTAQLDATWAYTAQPTAHCATRPN
jgi:hypothetical protein